MLCAWTAGEPTALLPAAVDDPDASRTRGCSSASARTSCPSLCGSASATRSRSSLAIAFGLLLGRLRRCAARRGRSCSSCASIPPPALIPFAILVIGIGDDVKIFLIAFVCMFPVLLNTIDGVAGIEPDAADTARVYASRGRDRLPTDHAARGGAADLRRHAALAVARADPDGDLTRWWPSTNGIGFFMLQAQRSFAIPEMWSGILLLGLLGYLFNFVFTARRAARAAPGTTARAGEERSMTMLEVDPPRQDATARRGGRREAIGDVSFDVDAGRVRLHRRPVRAAARRRC